MIQLEHCNIRAHGSNVLYALLLLIGSGFLLVSCEHEEDIRIPFGYDPAFDYLAILRSSPEYAYESAIEYPEFTYQDSTDEKLFELRNLYRLDSVAGTGHDEERILNLFRWVNQQINHDGANAAPDPENALSILEYCLNTGNGVNCVYMAIVFNEACLSLGYKSRVIHGNAKKFIFNGDWHAFNAVFNPGLKKWIFMDPMKHAYFMDTESNLLSIAEIRQFLIDGKELVINPDSDYNGLPFNQDEYLHYLTKNIYRLSCSVDSKFNNYGIFHLTGVTRRYAHLDPTGETQEGLGVAENHFTSNPDYFWTDP